ncbi:MAG: B-box zinc finger protein [Dehalococcoidales bacterium]|nr:B-box zinc finger protein [Dehalococcoidales bacterium]
MKCAFHPDVETNLRCGKCGKPICPKCLVQTPVGARCPDCAGLYKIPTYQVSTKYYLRATGTGVGMAIVCGIIWGAIMGSMPFFYLNFLLAPAVGYAIGEVISLSVNRKRGAILAIIAGVAVALSYVVSILSPWGLSINLVSIMHLILDIVAVGLGIFVAVNRLR